MKYNTLLSMVLKTSQLDPNHGPALFQEAMRFHELYGFPPKIPEEVDSALRPDVQERRARAQAEAMKQQQQGQQQMAAMQNARGEQAASPEARIPANLFVSQDEYTKCVEKCTDEAKYFNAFQRKILYEFYF